MEERKCLSCKKTELEHKKNGYDFKMLECKKCGIYFCEACIIVEHNCGSYGCPSCCDITEVLI